MTNHVPWAALACLHAAVATAQVVLPPNLGGPGAVQTVPGPAHDATLAALAAGDYRTALELAGQEYAGAVRSGQQRWIDSIAAAALLGECLFEAGSLRDAVARYEESMLLAASSADWLLSVQFPARPPQPLQRPPVTPWGRSARGVACAIVPETMTIRQGGADPEDVLKRGGLLVAPHDRTVRPQEIMRMLVVALYRHGHLLGPLARDNHALTAVTRVLTGRPAPPNHWSQAWIDVAQGTACWAQGKADVAEQLLRRGLLLGNQLDHALTPWALIVLGRIALDADQSAPAAKLFEEATYVAATYGDARALEEAFGLACAAQAAAGGRPPAAMLRAAAEWAQPTLPALRARLLALLAEAETRAGDPRRAADALREIDERLLRGEAGRGTLGAQAAYAAALARYATGDVAGADAELARGMAVAAGRAPRLFQTARLVELLRAGASDVPDREADALFGRLLGDPSTRDVATDPLGTLAVSAAERTEAFDTWVALAQRRGEEPALQAAEAATRGRWLAAQPLGGRRLAVERWLAADPRSLVPADAARRAALLAGERDLGDAVDRLERLRGTLGAALAAGAGDAALPGAPAEWADFTALAERRARLVAAFAAGREPVPWDFPPLLPTAEIRRRLRPRQLLLSFHWSRDGLVAALESRDRAAVWQVRQAAGIQRELETLARALGLFQAAGPVATDRLAEGDWRGSAARLERMLFENSQVTLAEGIDELVIVPDGWLWYLPFEILPVASQRADVAEARPLGEVCRVRYSPTRSLAVPRFEPRTGGAIGLHVGRMSRGEKPAAAAETVAHLAAAVEGLRPLDLPPGGPPLPVVAATLGALVVFDELDAGGPATDRTLVPAAPGRPRTTFADWLQPPLKRPRLVVLPGLETAMDSGLAAVPSRPGDDVFVAVTDLLAAGARTALVSRWRMGGRTSADLVTEFLRTAVRPAADGPPEDAATAWRRAIDVVAPEAPDPDREPRVRFVAAAPLADATHPLFWAGYLLVDGGIGVDEAIVAAAPAPGRAAP